MMQRPTFISMGMCMAAKCIEQLQSKQPVCALRDGITLPIELDKIIELAKLI